MTRPPAYRPYRRYRSGGFSEIGCFPIIVLLGIVLAVGWGIYSSFHVEVHEGCQVVDKDRTSDGNGGSDMRVYTENCGNFSVADSLLSWTWHSSDTYREIEVGQTYDLKTRGIRVPFFSQFPNITEAREAN